MVKPTAEQQSVEKLFPAIAQWVRGYGHIEIGDQEMFGFVARALDYGGLAFEDDKPDTLAEALATLEKGLWEYAWYDRQSGQVQPLIARSGGGKGEDRREGCLTAFAQSGAFSVGRAFSSEMAQTVVPCHLAEPSAAMAQTVVPCHKSISIGSPRTANLAEPFCEVFAQVGDGVRSGRPGVDCDMGYSLLLQQDDEAEKGEPIFDRDRGIALWGVL